MRGFRLRKNRTRFIESYAGKVKTILSNDGEFTARLQVGDTNIVWGIASILERFEGKFVNITIEEIREDEIEE